MKKSLLILLFVICFKTYGQLDYTFLKSTATYTELTSPTIDSSAWTQDFGIKLPFQFSYFSKPFDSLRISPNSINFTLNQSDFIAMGQEDYYYDGELYPAGSEISHLITGSAPNRIVKVQFKNLKAVTTDDTLYNYFVNNQIWIYEGSNKIEFHFGPNVNTDININTYYYGFRDSDGSPYLAISGTVSSPVLMQVMNVGIFQGISSPASNGTVYTFTPKAPSTGNVKLIRTYQFANNSESFSYCSSQNSTLVITDLLGKQITKATVVENNLFRFDYSLLLKGMYLVTINSNNQLYTEKIIVQ